MKKKKLKKKIKKLEKALKLLKDDCEVAFEDVRNRIVKVQMHHLKGDIK